MAFARDIKGAAIAIAALTAILFSLSFAIAEEKIHRFDSQIEIAPDGELIVTETITVRAEGRQIKRGIFRDFPLQVKNASGRNVQVGFEIVSVKRGGKTESYHTEKISKAIRIYFGKKDYFLPEGNYTYTLTYKTDRQIRFFEGHDELFWNVTGNFWSFPISEASATITLPNGAKAFDTIFFTGPFGAKGKDAIVKPSERGNVVSFLTTKTLNRHEGLTVGIKFPKGVVAQPDENALFLRDNIAELLSGGLLAFLTLFYFLYWKAVGVDPKPGTIVPRWDAPDGISPALTNYIYRRGLSGKGWDAIASAIVNLSVSGHLKLTELGFGGLHLEKTGKAPSKSLPVGERSIFNYLTTVGGDLEIIEDNGKQVKSLQSKFSSAMESEHRGVFYKHNWMPIALGLFLSVIGLIAVAFFAGFLEDAVAIIFPLAILSAVTLPILINTTKSVMSGKGMRSKISAIVSISVLTFFLFSAAPSIIPQITSNIDRPVLTTIIIGIVVLNILFFYLLGAPTPTGRKMMDGIEGMRLYLNLAEKDRMNMKSLPKMSPEHFQALLPYAIALGVEKPWSQTFEKWLLAAAATGAVASTWGPDWYGGRNFDADRISDTFGGLSNTLQDSFTAAMPAPQSSSSGFSGGGSSGGGGGGGGGGGW